MNNKESNEKISKYFSFKHSNISTKFFINLFSISEFEMIFKGFDATERNGVFYAISDQVSISPTFYDKLLISKIPKDTDDSTGFLHFWDLDA